MAKSASDTKVEDVLSSVRRLVSEELPRNERPVLPEGPGALVLTDAQRIESTAAGRIAGRSLEERIAELEAAVGETANDDEFEPDGSEDQAVHRPNRIVYTRPPASSEVDEARRNTLRLSQIALIDTGPANEEPSEDGDVHLEFRRDTSSSSEVEEAPMAEDVKETLTAAEVHIFSSPDDEIARIEARLNGEPAPEVPPKSAVEPDVLPDSDAQQEKAIQEEQPVETPSVPEMAEDVEPAEAEVATSDATDDDDFEAHLEEAVAASVEPEQEADHEPEDVPAVAEDAETALAEEAIGGAIVDILDEEDLRPIVSRLIREELQGELGERITRNVRKLVRREILRALAARDAE